MKKLPKQQVFKDPLYGFIHVNDVLIKKLIDSELFQRLRRIRQLSGVQMVFHGAEHSRFVHSLGVYEIANRFLSVPDIAEALNEREKMLFLVSALLHDIGHGAYSHAFEKTFNVNHEEIGAKLITSNKELRSILDMEDETFAEDVSRILRKEKKFPLIEQLISSQLDVDRLDYLERDAYYTGAAYGHIDVDRLIRVLYIKQGKVVFKVSGIHAIENYLIARYHMYWQVYYHPVARAYEVNLEKIYERVRYLLEQGFHFESNVDPLKCIMKNPEDLDAYIEIDDFYINGLIASFLKSKDDVLRKLAHDFMNRHIWGYINDVEENKEQIEKIKASFKPEELKYFTSHRTVFNSTYQDRGEGFGDQIYILLENGKISSLKDQSKIIESLMLSGTKNDPKFFYRK
ncbi:MAG TPA: phosphohydrolase [Acholeplasmataceae bacterium]|nr:phosphohydrolase [Acholeplasmataceae bacterium]HBO66659.1 phosphohydrolase [Acholeplasmataceae bacterium]HBS00935.1 phosphohydrolase [Acholeplasmataceae bacterium]HCZ23246.1 phosphohydrolase [Acholeplasmataceae bacterium]